MVKQQPKKRLRRPITKHDKEKTQIQILPKSENQKLYIEALKGHSQVVSLGPSGTGKTYLASTHAANQYNLKNIDKIIITRPHVTMGKDPGSLPGTLEDKCAPWALPVIDVLEQHLGKGAVETGIKNGNIKTEPLAYIRGRTFNDSIIILDEAQNLTVKEFKAFITRTGINSQVLINGDIRQSDLKFGDGLTEIIRLIKKYQVPIPMIEMTVDDIFRGEITKMWVEIFMEEGI